MSIFKLKAIYSCLTRPRRHLMENPKHPIQLQREEQSLAGETSPCLSVCGVCLRTFLPTRSARMCWVPQGGRLAIKKAEFPEAIVFCCLLQTVNVVMEISRSFLLI